MCVLFSAYTVCLVPTTNIRHDATQTKTAASLRQLEKVSNATSFAVEN